MHLLPRMNECLVSFERCQSSYEEHGTSENYNNKKVLFIVELELSHGKVFRLQVHRLKVIPGEAGFRTDCLKILVYNTKEIILQTSIVVSFSSGLRLPSIQTNFPVTVLFVTICRNLELSKNYKLESF